MGILHVLVNALYVTVGIVAGNVVALLLRIERRSVVRLPFVVALLVVALVVGLLVTLLTPDTVHVGAGLLVGLPIGVLTALFSRLRSKPGGAAKTPPRAR